MEPVAYIFKIWLEIPEADLIIENIDIDFYIHKTKNNEPDKAKLNLWNLDENIYLKLIEKQYLINIFIQNSNLEANLVFSGYINFEQLTRSRIKNNIHTKSINTLDILTTLTLIDSKPAYTEPFINKNYRDDVSALQIITDCIEAAGLTVAAGIKNIPEKIYPSYKAIGKPYNIIKQICNELDIQMRIDNQIIYIGNNTDDENFINPQNLDFTNSLEPKLQGNSSKLIISTLIPNITRTSKINCEFPNLNGEASVLEIIFQGNNYNKATYTKIFIN